MVGNISAHRQLLLAGIAVLLAVLAVLAAGATVSATNHYPPNRDGAKQFAVDFCRDNPIGMADFVWLSAPSSENETTISVVYPNTTVDVRVNVYTTYCSGYPWGADAGSRYQSDIGGVTGIFYYENEAANRTWYDYQIKKMNVDRWGSGNHRICMTLTSWSAGLNPEPSPSACSVLRLNVTYPWTTDGRSLVGVGRSPNVTNWPYAKPGQTVYWNHRIWNNSSSNMSRDTSWHVDQEGFTYSGSLWRNSSTSPSGSSRGGPGNVNASFVNTGPSVYDTQYVVRDEEVGNTLCQTLRWSPSRWDGGEESRRSCITVPYDFNLTPKIAPITNAAEPGVTVGPVTPSVVNDGATWSYKDTNWQLSRFVVGPGGAKPGGNNGTTTAPCSHYGNGCTPVTSGAQQFVRGETVVGQIPSVTVDDLALGSQLCYGLSVKAFNPDSSNLWRHSEPQCIKIGKKPKLQVWGDDVAVRGAITTSTTKKNGTMFGSWVEYGALSVGTNTQFASGAGLVDQTSDLQKDWSLLTFANSGTPSGVFGLYTIASSGFRPQPMIAQYFSSGKPTQAYDKAATLNDNAFVTGDSVVVRTTDTLDLTADTLPKGRSLVIVASGTVTIKGNLDYANGAMTSVRDMPQLVIIAGKINIEADVTNVDAWLVTSNAVTGEIDTCSTVTGNLSGEDCNKQLTVNGPVLAGKLLLKRTAGSGTGDQSGDPAEIFNLRPDAHLWAQLVALGSGRAETVDVVELPPRF